jgi:outer membrane immunogenic protein
VRSTSRPPARNGGFFGLGCDKRVTVKISHSTRIRRCWQGHRDEKANCDRAFGYFLCAGTSFAADWPFAAPPQLSRAGSLPVNWTGLYVGVNAGYGSATGSSTTAFTGAFAGGTTTQFGIGATELSGTNLVGSSSLRGGIAGGQIGSNWQAGMFVFGGEVDVQWSGQQATASVVCTPGCIASEAVNIKLFATGRARIGLAFDWFLPYVTAGGALVSAQDKLTVTVGGITGNFNSLSNNTAGWTAGAGFDVALSSNWSARFEYLQHPSPLSWAWGRHRSPPPDIETTSFGPA